MQVAIVTFQEFNEIDTFVALSILNRFNSRGVEAKVCGPDSTLVSMNGVELSSVRPLEYANDADAVLIGSGRGTLKAIETPGLIERLELDSNRQYIGSQCSGALVLNALGLLNGLPVCSDRTTRPLLEKRGVVVAEESFKVHKHIATAGGCLASQYLAAWLLREEFGDDAVAEALGYVAPVGEEKAYAQRALAAISK